MVFFPFFVFLTALVPLSLCATQKEWSLWGPWGLCTKTCGGGVQSRERKCRGGLGCPGRASDQKVCNAQSCIGKWSDWGPWSDCDKPCLSGRQSRKRLCFGGPTCLPPTGNEDTRFCNPGPCPLGQWSEWTQWGECSRTCIGGRRERRRDCQGSEPGTNCPGLDEMSEPCGVGACGVTEGFWQPWLTWTPCSRSCNGGTRRRLRTCIGGPCRQGKNSEEEGCNLETCGDWTPWSTWSDCSKTCGSDGRQNRKRTCQGDLSCNIGEASETRLCLPIPQACPLFDLTNLFQSNQDASSILSSITNMISGLLQNPSGLFSSLGLSGGLSNGGLPPLGNFLGPLMRAIPPATPGAGRSIKIPVAEQRKLIREAARAAYNRVKGNSRK